MSSKQLFSKIWTSSPSPIKLLIKKTFSYQQNHNRKYKYFLKACWPTLSSISHTSWKLQNRSGSQAFIFFYKQVENCRKDLSWWAFFHCAFMMNIKMNTNWFFPFIQIISFERSILLELSTFLWIVDILMYNTYTKQMPYAQKACISNNVCLFMAFLFFSWLIPKQSIYRTALVRWWWYSTVFKNRRQG